MLGWVTAYVIIHVSVIMLRRREPNAERPYRSPLVPIPQILGIGLLGLAAYKIAPPGIESSSIYWRWFIFLLDRRGVLARLQPLHVQEPGRDHAAGAARRGLS